MMYTLPKIQVVTLDICPECFGGLATCTHGARQDNGLFIHEIECPDCGEESAAIVCYDCAECKQAVSS